MRHKSLWITLIAASLVVASLPAAHAYTSTLHFGAVVNEGRYHMRTLYLGPNPHTPAAVTVRITGGTTTAPPPKWRMELVNESGDVVARGRRYVGAYMLGQNCRLYVYNDGGRNLVKGEITIDYNPTPAHPRRRR